MSHPIPPNGLQSSRAQAARMLPTEQGLFLLAVYEGLGTFFEEAT